MSDKHRQAIQASRDVLVDNMLPDDIFNDLICRKILTTADVSRIKVYICQFRYMCVSVVCVIVCMC